MSDKRSPAPSLADIIAAVPDIGDKAAREVAIARLAFDAGLRAAVAQPDPLVWECKAGGLRPLTQRHYEAQTDATKRHYSRIPAAQVALEQAAIMDGLCWAPVAAELRRLADVEIERDRFMAQRDRAEAYAIVMRAQIEAFDAIKMQHESTSPKAK